MIYDIYIFICLKKVEVEREIGIDICRYLDKRINTQQKHSACKITHIGVEVFEANSNW